ncbi:MAG: hypothetical protein IT307_15460 [Chloroflexi bacterium]|nr:hypothetical protein [Chloroflexota bacterium]
MKTTPAHHTLQTFRQKLYQTLCHRRDALFELLEAVLVAPVRSTLARLSLTPVFRRHVRGLERLGYKVSLEPRVA